jgi:hypothetical protein
MRKRITIDHEQWPVHFLSLSGTGIEDHPPIEQNAEQCQ